MPAAAITNIKAYVKFIRKKEAIRIFLLKKYLLTSQ